MTALAIFEHSNNEFSVEFLTGDGLAFRVLAPGLAKALGFREAFDLLRMIPDTEKGSELVRTLGGVQTVGFVTESGFYRALGQRQAARIPDDTIREQVERFQSWVYGTVLPSLRTGQRAAEKLTRADLARMVIEEADRAELAEALER
jgi:anti-repressor protein